MVGQLTDMEFRTKYPTAMIRNDSRTAITYYGKYTINYWIQHEDYSWTNYDCKTDNYYRQL